jgi:hypothetical protein
MQVLGLTHRANNFNAWLSRQKRSPCFLVKGSPGEDDQISHKSTVAFKQSADILNRIVAYILPVDNQTISQKNKKGFCYY